MKYARVICAEGRDTAAFSNLWREKAYCDTLGQRHVDESPSVPQIYN